MPSETTVVVNLLLVTTVVEDDGSDYTPSLATGQFDAPDALAPRPDEAHLLEGDPPTPSEQQEALRRVIEKEIVLMRHNAANPDNELVPLAVNDAAADAIHALAESVNGQVGQRLDLYIT